MDIRSALKEQYHAGLAMLRQCVELCPDDLWVTHFPCPQDPDRTIVRSFSRIAFHAVYFTHLYLGQGEAAFQPPPDDLAVRQRLDNTALWRAPWEVEPFEMPESVPPHSQKEILDYIDFVGGLIDPTVDGLVLDTEDSGFSWYASVSKLSHELLNLRHVQGHVGQLSEHLMAQDIDIDWVSRGPRDID